MAFALFSFKGRRMKESTELSREEEARPRRRRKEYCVMIPFIIAAA